MSRSDVFTPSEVSASFGVEEVVVQRVLVDGILPSVSRRGVLRMRGEDAEYLARFVHWAESAVAENPSAILSLGKPDNRVQGVYYIQQNEAVKIGWSSDVGGRLDALQTSSPAHLKLLCWERAVAAQAERDRHNEFAEQHIRGEWFRLDGTLLSHIATISQRYFGIFRTAP